MAENTNFEREYTIPLRREIMKVPAYRRSGRAVKAIKQFIAKHMKVADRDVDKVKLNIDFNNEVWLRGKTNPPTKVKVKATKEGEIVKVTFVEMPERVKFNIAKNARFQQPASEKSEPSAPKQEKSKATEAEKKDEKEKEASVAEAAQKEAKSDAKEKKHTTKVEKHVNKERMIPKK